MCLPYESGRDGHRSGIPETPALVGRGDRIMEWPGHTRNGVVFKFTLLTKDGRREISQVSPPSTGGDQGEGA